MKYREREGVGKQGNKNERRKRERKIKDEVEGKRARGSRNVTSQSAYEEKLSRDSDRVDGNQEKKERKIKDEVENKVVRGENVTS